MKVDTITCILFIHIKHRKSKLYYLDAYLVATFAIESKKPSEWFIAGGGQ